MGPQAGVPVVLQYGHRLQDSNVWLTVQGSLALNADGPDDSLMKGGAVGLDLGAEWHSGETDTAHVYLGATAGARFYMEPGAGVVVHALAGGQVPLNSAVALFLQGRAGVGIARVGDESPDSEAEQSYEGTAGVRLHF